MTKEEAIKYLQQLYPNGGHCWLDEQRIEAIDIAVKALQEEPVSEDLDEAAKKAATWHSRVRGDVFFHNDYQKFIEGAKWQEEQMIGKACDWLEEHLLDFWSQRNTNTDYFIEEFKQAIEQ